MSRNFVSVLLLSCLLCLTSAARDAVPAAAQQNAAQQTDAPQTQPDGSAAQEESGPQPIATTDIPDRSEELGSYLREVDARWEKPAVSEAFMARLDEIDQEIADQQIAIASLEDSTITAQLFERYRQIWQATLNTLQRPEFDLKNQDAHAAADLDSLTTMQETWTVTRDASISQSDDEEIPESIQLRIDEALAKIDTTKQIVLDQRSILLVTKDRIVGMRGTCRENLTRIGNKQEASRTQMLETGVEPLWTAIKNSPGWSHTWSALVESIDLNFATAKTHIELHKVQVIVRIALLALVSLFFYYLRGRARLFSAYDESFGKSVIALETPISAAMLLVILTLAFLDSQVVTVADFLLLTLLYPLLLLVPKLIPANLSPVLFSFALVYIISWLSDLFAAETLVSRSLVLLASSLTIVNFLWARRNIKPMLAETSERWPKLMMPFSILAIAMMVVAIYTDVVGHPLLAEILISGTLAAFFSAILLWAMIAVLRGVTAVLLRSQTVQRLRIVQLHGDELQKSLLKTLTFLAHVAWFYFTLRGYGIARTVITAVKDFLFTPLVIGSATIDLGGLLLMILVIWLSFTISRMVSFVLDKDILPRLNLARGVPATISRLSQYTILLVGFILAVSAAGLDLNRFTVIGGALGVGLGFGLQNIVNNFVSGLILLFERPISIGDRIQVGEMVCVVKNIGIRASTVRTFDGAEVIVPNSLLVNNEVTNWTLSDRNRRVKIPIGVAYGSDTELVLKIFADVASKNELVLTSPAPELYFVGFGESSLDFSLRVWVDQQHDWLQVRSDICAAVDVAFAEAGVTIPFPQRDLHLRSVDSEQDLASLADGENLLPSAPPPQPQPAAAPTPPAAPAPKAKEPPPQEAASEDGDGGADGGADGGGDE